MSEITDDELWILFTGSDELPDYFRKRGYVYGECIDPDKQHVIEVIKNFIVDVPKLINPNYILRLMYCRKLIFVGELVLATELKAHYNDLIVLLKKISICVKGTMDIDAGVLNHTLDNALGRLWASGMLNCGYDRLMLSVVPFNKIDWRNTHYFLTDKGESVAKEWFQNLILEAEQSKKDIDPPPGASPYPIKSEKRDQTPSPSKPTKSKKNSDRRNSCGRKEHQQKLRKCLTDFLEMSTKNEKVILKALAKKHGLRAEALSRGEGKQLITEATQKVRQYRETRDPNVISDFFLQKFGKDD